MNKDIFRKVIFLIVHFGAAQLILMIATPWFTRLYTPSDFAYFGYIITFSTIILPLSSFQYEYAIQLIHNQKIIDLLTKLCIIIVILMTITSFVVSKIIQQLCHIFSINNLMIVSACIIISLQGILQIYSMRLIANAQVEKIGIGKIIQNLVMICIQILVAYYFTHSSMLLLTGLMAGLLINVIYSQKIVYRDSSTKKGYNKLTRTKIFYILKRYYQLPLYSSLASLIESVSTFMPILLIGPLYGKNALGVYFLIYRIFSAPITLMNTAVSRVMLKELGDRVKGDEQILDLFKKTSMILFGIAICYMFLMKAIANYVPVIFGQSWSEGGSVLNILAPVLSISVCISPLSSVFILLRRNKIDLIWQAIYLLSTIFIFYVCRTMSFSIMLNYLTNVLLILYLLYWYLMYRVISVRDEVLYSVK